MRNNIASWKKDIRLIASNIRLAKNSLKIKDLKNVVSRLRLANNYIEELVEEMNENIGDCEVETLE